MELDFMSSSRSYSRQKFHFSLLIPSILLSLLLGFLGSLIVDFAYSQIKTIEHEDVFFLGFKLAVIFGFLAGFFLKRILDFPFSSYLELGIIILQITQIILIIQKSSLNLQVDYIFFTQYFQFFTFLNAFSSGYLISGMKGLRLWAFLTGVFSFFTYSYFTPLPELNVITYSILGIFVFLFEFLLHSAFPWLHRQSLKKVTLPPKPINDVFFYASFTLFISHSILYYLSSESNLRQFALGSASGILIFNGLHHIISLRKNFKLAHLVGRIALLFNISLTSSQLYLTNYFFFLFFLDLAGISFFKPTRLRKGYTGMALFSGFSIAYISLNLQTKYTKTELFFTSILLVVTFIWLSLIFKAQIGILNKILTLALSFLLSSYFYTPLPFRFLIQNEDLYIDENPIPFTMTKLDFNEEDFIFFHSPLPFHNSPKLPHKKDIKNKIVVLGLRNKPELVLTYVKYLHQNEYPYLIFQNRSFDILDSKEIPFLYVEYPMFRVYYPNYGLGGKILHDPKKEMSSSWEKEFIESKYRNLSSGEEIASALEHLTQYSGYELAQKAKAHKQPFFESYKKYTEYYYQTGKYHLAIQTGILALRFQDEDLEVLEIIYQSLLNSIPETSHIPIMQKLSNYPNFKEMILKRLYPMYLAIGKEKEALSSIENLISFYNSSNSESKEESIQVLLAAKVKILMKLNKYYEAEEIIRKSLAKQPNSQQWQRIALDLKYLKESTRNYYYYYNQNYKKQEEVSEQ
ncbi:MAG: hypothetical protein N3A69_07350 [Leptospiraceae bacterium]|nr:hypothetical protein [Leptospiraceae bacterium]